MADADNTLAEALLRIEHKLDILLERSFRGPHPDMKNPSPCPICGQRVEFQVDLQQQVVKRKCGCTTGKLPPLSPIFPVAPQGVANGTAPESAERVQGSEDGPRRKEG